MKRPIKPRWGDNFPALITRSSTLLKLPQSLFISPPLNWESTKLTSSFADSPPKTSNFYLTLLLRDLPRVGVSTIHPSHSTNTQHLQKGSSVRRSSVADWNDGCVWISNRGLQLDQSYVVKGVISRLPEEKNVNITAVDIQILGSFPPFPIK